MLSFFVTWLSGFLVCILWYFLFYLVYSFLGLFFCVMHSSQKRPPKKPDTEKSPKIENAEKHGQKNSASAVVFTNSVPYFWGGLKNSVLAESTIKIVVSASFLKGKWPQNAKEVESKLGPSMLRNKIGPSFDSKNGKLCLLVLFMFFFVKSHSPCSKKKIFEEQEHKKQRKIGPSLDSKKRLFLDQVLTPQHIGPILVFDVVC